jgi:hypothetical protein
MAGIDGVVVAEIEPGENTDAESSRSIDKKKQL